MANITVNSVTVIFYYFVVISGEGVGYVDGFPSIKKPRRFWPAGLLGGSGIVFRIRLTAGFGFCGYGVIGLTSEVIDGNADK